MKKVGLALAFAAAIALTFAGCSNSSDNSAALALLAVGAGNGNGNGIESLPTESANFKAETVSGGVKLTIKAPQDSNKYTDVLQIMIQNPSIPNEIGWIYPDWQDKSQAWTGVYPLVDDGKKESMTCKIPKLR